MKTTTAYLLSGVFGGTCAIINGYFVVNYHQDKYNDWRNYFQSLENRVKLLRSIDPKAVVDLEDIVTKAVLYSSFSCYGAKKLPVQITKTIDEETVAAMQELRSKLFNPVEAKLTYLTGEAEEIFDINIKK